MQDARRGTEPWLALAYSNNFADTIVWLATNVGMLVIHRGRMYNSYKITSQSQNTDCACDVAVLEIMTNVDKNGDQCKQRTEK